MNPNHFAVFSKHLQDVPLERAGELLRGIGVSRIDLTVRTGGHVEPERVADNLPAAAEALEKSGVAIGMISTEIVDAGSAYAERVLRTAAKLGIGFYKLGYVRYEGFGSIRRLRQETAARLKDLAAMNLALNIHGGYHNHSDTFFGANLADLDFVLAGIDPRAIGVYFDPAHATIEGGSAGWLIALDLIGERITMLAVKDFRWVEGHHRYAGGRRQSVEFCPLAEGNTPWPKVIAVLKQLSFSGQVSFHSEYQGEHSFENLTALEVAEQTAKDVTLFREWLCA